MTNTVLGLDLGPNSIGWAFIDKQNKKIVDTGVRVFPEGVDNFDTSKEVSRSEARRIARGMRRQTARRARRKRKLRDALIASGLFPEDPSKQEILFQQDPYVLRARALDKQISLYDLGRIFLHLAQRRGYLSNSKKEAQKAEGKIVLSEINVTASQIEEEDCRTLGEFLARRLGSFDHAQRETEDVLPNIRKEVLKDKGRVRNRHLRREMYEDEFAAIWEKQTEFYPQLLTEKLRYGTTGRKKYPAQPIAKPHAKKKLQSELELFGIHGLLFFHRSLKPVPKEIIGLCELEPKQRRCPCADRQAQRFRLLSEINNLRYSDPDTHEERNLDKDQRAILLPYMATREKATFDQIRKKLGFLESVRFNLERGKRSSIKGSETDSLMAKAAGKEWHNRPDEEKDEIVRLLLNDLRDEDVLADQLESKFGFSAEQAEKALGIDFPSGYIHLSLRAIEKLLPYMEQGMVYQAEDESNSAIHAAGYMRRDELQRRLFDTLPPLNQLVNAKLGDIPNPVVKRALVELKKVVNAIIREYGKPNEIHVEMARSVRMGPQARSEYNSRIREREVQRDRAREELRKRGMGYGAGGRNILRYLLWEEQAHECVYCGNSISQDQLFGGEVDIDHILPRKRSLDDSQVNKVVCHRHCNHDKGDQIPHEWLAADDPERYERICQHVASLMHRHLMPYTKYRRFLLKELKLDDFIARQLVDTGYIAKATSEYLRCLFKHDHDVLGLKGQLTSELRHQWGLDTILEELPDSPAWQAQSDLRSGEKNRADHRHHAIDAIVVALTDRSRLQKLSRIVKQGGIRETGEILDDPWDNFREEVVEKIKEINVSHRVQRKASGQLHEDTIYGPTSEPDQWVSRKPVDTLSPNEIEKIRDEGIRQIIINRLREKGVEFGRGVKVENKIWKEVLSDLRMPSGVSIRKVRIVKPEKTIQPIREGSADEAYVKPGSTHHLCIFEFNERGKTKREAVFVTMLDAVNRVKLGEPIIQRTHPDRPDAKFVMSLSRGEMILTMLKDKREVILTFKTAASTQGQLYFAHHTDARRSSEQMKYVFKANTLEAKKITIDPIGRIRWAND